MDSKPFQQAPIVAGLALIGCGVLMTQLRPHLLNLPGPVQKTPAKRSGATASVRDTLLDIMPPNLLVWLGRVLMLAGASVVLTRLLDRMVDDRGMTD